MTKSLATMFCVLILSISVQAQTIISVPGDLPSIQAALDAAESNTNIEVAPGTYYENIIWPEESEDIHLIGSDASETIIDGSGVDQVIQITNVLNSSIRGFTIQNGFLEITAGEENIGGAGLYIENSNLILEDLVIKENHGYNESISTFISFYGAGVYINQFEGDIINCIFSNNKIGSYSGFGAALYANNFSGNIESCEFISNEIIASYQTSGGGASIIANGDITIDDCEFNGNIFRESYGIGAGLSVQLIEEVNQEISVEILNSSFINNSMQGGSGAGIYIGNSNITGGPKYMRAFIDSCLFEGNHILSEMNGFALNGRGAAVFILDKKITISNSIFENNQSQKGACIYRAITDDLNAPLEEMKIESCYFGSNTSDEGSVLYTSVSFNTLTNFTNCVMTKNIGSTILADGLLSTGNIYYVEISLNHCTIAFNEGGMNLNLAELKATNSIFWNPNSTEFVSEGSNFTMKNCLIDGGGVGQNTITEDPLFISQDELKPTENSPCIGAGTRSLNLDQDIEGNPRPVPANSNPDIGAYELVYGISSVHEEYPLEFGVYPNPVTDKLYFDEQVDMYEVYNVNGSLVSKGESGRSISVIDLNPGVYTIIVGRKGDLGKMKFVKM